MRLSLAGILTALLTMIAAAAAADVGEFIDRPIVSVTLQLDGRPTDDARLTGLLAVHQGDRLTLGAVRESIAHLFSLGRFGDVQVQAESQGSGVTLTFVLARLRPVARFSFVGDAPNIDRGRLRRAVVERFGSVPRAERAADVSQLLEDELKQVGYLRARVTPRVVVAGDDETSTLMFELSPGARAHVASVRVQGDAGVSERDLLDRLDIESGAVYQRESLNAQVERYLEERKREGFYEARLSVTTELSDDDRLVNLTLVVAQGPRVKVVFRGDPLPAERRDELVPIAREGSTDEDLLEDSSNRVQDYLRAQGYRDARAPFSREDVEGELHLTFTVTRGAQYRVARIELVGNTTLSLTTLQARLRVREGQPFSVSALEADLAQIEDLYRREGFANVQARSTTTPEPIVGGATDVPVAIRVEVIEGVRTVVRSVRFIGNRAVPEQTLSSPLGLRPGRPFFLTQMAIDRDAIQLQYANLGYPAASVTSNPGIDDSGTTADVVFTVREGLRVFIDHVLIVGNQRTRTATIERELRFKSGDPLGLEALSDSQRRLSALGLFRRARITELGHGDETRRDVLVTVEEAPVTTLGYGGGLEVGQRIRRTGSSDGVASERIELAPRAFFEIGRRNLFGKNRSVNLFSRLSLRSRNSIGAERSFSEYRVIGTFREPRVVGTGADAFLTGTIEQQVRSSFNFARRAFSAEVARRLTPRVSLSGNYQIQRTELFDEQNDEEFRLLIDRAFPQVRLSSFSLSAVRDTRDDLTDPLEGHFLSTNGQLAGRRIGSEIGFAKSYLSAQRFQLIPRTRRTVFALSARLGLAAGFPRQVPVFDNSGAPIFDAQGRPVTRASVDLPASERFFAGGDTTVRGFALDQLGTPDTIDTDGFPVGGGGLMIFNAELRVPLRGGLGVVGFLDAGNVFKRPATISLSELRSSVGFGVRYRSPIGPIRVDVGFKTERREIAVGKRESPAALHISLGQAF